MLHRHVCTVAQNGSRGIKPSQLHIVVETKIGLFTNVKKLARGGGVQYVLQYCPPARDIPTSKLKKAFKAA